MATTVAAGFDLFLSRLTPTGSETEAAKKHRASIEQCLKNDFNITRFFRTGSFGIGTSIRGCSDVDYFASMPVKYGGYTSTSVLKTVWDSLDARFPNTGVGIRTPAVVVPFAGGDESTDLVPAVCVEQTSAGHLVYKIADGSGGWMKSSPDAHSAYVVEVNKRLSGKVKPLIRFVKAWKYYRNVPIYSFYLEMRIAKYAEGESSIVYSIDIKNFLRHLVDNDLPALQDPTGVSGYINPCYSDAMKKDARSKLDTAYGRAVKAYAAEAAEDHKTAFYYWDLLFDGKFPAYG